MKTLKLLSAFLCAVMILFSLSPAVLSLSGPVGPISGEIGRFFEEITLSDGTETGVRYTEMNLSETYGSNKVLRLAECDLSNTNLSIDVINCGAYIASKKTVASASDSFSANGKTVLAALNGDLWMTGVNSNSNVTKKVLQTTRGVMIIDREIWATQEFGMENYMNTSNPGTNASLKSAFGVTSQNQPLVGAPVFTVTVTNESKDTSLTADGLNRLPAWDSVVVYNHRVNSSNYALDDSYEIELVADSTAFTLDNTVKARVVAVYPSGSATRPSLNENTIVITARGSRIGELSENYRPGDIVSFDFSLTDKLGRTELWQDVVDAIGGHMQVIEDGTKTFTDTSSSEYPTSLIGIKDDGTVMFANINSATNGTYKGLRFKDAYQLCKELEYNSVFYLDGGGSSSIVTLKDGTYTQRNYSADGAPRSVINAVAMVWNDTPVCKEQGSLSYIISPDEFSDLPSSFVSAGLLHSIVSNTNALDTSYSPDTNTLHLEPSQATNDAYIGFDFTVFDNAPNAEQYKFITLKLKTNIDTTTDFSLYYKTDASVNLYCTTLKVSPSDDYIFVSFNLVNSTGWSGNIEYLRLDIFEGIISDKGQTVYIEYVAFSSVPRDVMVLQNGSYPIGAIKDYFAYKDCKNAHDMNVYNEYSDTLHLVECVNCGISATDAHSFANEHTVDKKPTSTDVGESSRHCIYCPARTDVTIIPVLSFIKGDVNCDGSVNGIDANLLQKYLAGKINIPLKHCDINGDGAANAKDSHALKLLLAGV